MHRLLRRQIERHSSGAAVPAEMQPLLDAIDAAYTQYETDRAMLERSLELSSQELLLANAEMASARKALAEHAKELARSNSELEQFAYVASHDLQEPLRTVQSYLQLLERRHAGQLDASAKEFIAFAVDAAKRMRELISDLLTYARVSSRGKPFEDTDLNGVIDEVLGSLSVAISEKDAGITRDPMPTVYGDRRQLAQLYQNLIANALKFHGDKPPRIHLGVTTRESGWDLWVKDEGIGLDSRYAEKIFVIFQRLHGKDEYPGTGIGLAVCKKIVERHGGTISVLSEPGRGATFHVVIPARNKEAP